MKFVGAVKVYTLADKITDIRQELTIVSFENNINRYNHPETMQQDILPWIALNYMPKDQISLVHPRLKLVLEEAVQRGEDDEDDDDDDYI